MNIITLGAHAQRGTVVNPRRACAARVTVVGFVCVCRRLSGEMKGWPFFFQPWVKIFFVALNNPLVIRKLVQR